MCPITSQLDEDRRLLLFQRVEEEAVGRLEAYFLVMFLPLFVLYNIHYRDMPNDTAFRSIPATGEPHFLHYLLI